jgi:hypothetical protein
MGKQTPVHVNSRNPALIDAFKEHGFAGRIDLTDTNARPMRHHGFLSMFLEAMNAAYGVAPHVRGAYREHGVTLFDEPAADVEPRSHTAL